MKQLIIVIMILAATPAFAARINVGFKGYSAAAASPTECQVFGQAETLARMGDSRDVAQGFSPDPSKSRLLSLGTKYFATYSSNVGAISWTCRTVGTATLVKAKVYLNAVETQFLTLDQGTWWFGK